MTLKNSGSEVREVGDFVWSHEEDFDDSRVRCLIVMLPGSVRASLPVEPLKLQSYRTFWNWDGNIEAPTLSPSIDGSADGAWHGHIENGELIG